MSRAELDEIISSALQDSGIDYVKKDSGRFFVTLPGVKKLRTNCWLIVTDQALVVEAFVCRQPDEDHENVYRFLLQRNAKLYGVYYTLDHRGDIYLIGRISLTAVTADELDRILGQVLSAADEDFNTLLELGFATAIRKEWDWRTSRGESLANLQAFQHLIDPVSPATETSIPAGD